MLKLEQQAPLAEGGNRLVFVHPDDSNRCIKVAHPKVTLAAKRARKGFKGRLKPASSFDDNAEEWRVMQRLQRSVPDIGEHIPHCDGFVETDLGPGLVSKLVRSDNGDVALPLKMVVWENGLTDQLAGALNTLEAFWVERAVPSRALILHNVIVEQRENGAHLWVIDGIGSSDFWPFARWSKTLGRSKAQRKIDDLRERIDKLLTVRAEGGDPGRHGFMRFRSD